MAGLALLWKYANTPGFSGQAPPNWPTATGLKLSPADDTLVMFVHPQCPCSQASVGELEKIVARAPNATYYVVVYKPSGTSAAWEHTSLIESTAKVPDVQIVIDRDGGELRRFHAGTSGATYLYDSSGKLLFSGGITGSRGHAGDNDGATAIVDLLTTGHAAIDHTPVFGCSLGNASNDP